MLADSLQELFDERLYGGRGAGNDTRSLRVGGQQLGRFVQQQPTVTHLVAAGGRTTRHRLRAVYGELAPRFTWKVHREPYRECGPLTLAVRY